MDKTFNHRYPSVEDLRRRSKSRLPKFAFEYLDGGCNEDVNLVRNTKEIRDIQLVPRYLKSFTKSELKTELFGHVYDAPFGIAPVGLQGLIWPNSPNILAKAAFEHNIPFILSTVSTTSIEEICNITEGKAWFQLYNPSKEEHLKDLLSRAWSSGCRTLVLLCDVPSFGFRPRDIRNGLSMPPRMTSSNIWQILTHPKWSIQTLKHGKPNFETIKPYMPGSLNMRQLGKFMDEMFSGRLDKEKISKVRDLWKGNLVLKGVASMDDTQAAISTGLDGIIVSNHGGRQLDAAESSINSMIRIKERFDDKITIMMDSGIRSGPDIARCIAEGADFSFLGRSFMYAVGALGRNGGNHIIHLLKAQLAQVLDQLSCEDLYELKTCKR